MRKRWIHFENKHIILWCAVGALVIVVQFIWVPFRLADESIDWSWAWKPPMVVDEEGQAVFDQIVANSEPPVDQQDRELHEALQRPRLNPADRAWTGRGLDWPAGVLIITGVIAHIALGLRIE
jgi:hypothetical protein